MLSFLTPEGAPNYRKLIISPKQVALVANGVMGDFFYLEITPIYFLFYLILYVPINNLSVTLGRIFRGPPGVLGIWGEWLFIFMELGSTGNYFRGSREQALIFGDLGSPAKKQKNKGKASILFEF